MAKKSSKKDSGKKNKKGDSKKQKSKIDEKDKKFIITLISVLVILAIIVLTVYNQTGPHNPGNNSSMIECPSGSENADVCTQEYKPVCGYDSEGNQIETFSNDCHACKNTNVSQFTRGQC